MSYDYRLGEECDDGILRQEMEQAARSLLITGRNILLAVQKLCIQPNVRKHREDLIIAAQNILTGTLKILQLEDDASVRKILEAVDWLLECLSYLQKADSVSHLLSHFYEFSEALLLVNTLTERRILEVKDTFHQSDLSQTLQILRKCVPMLYTVTQSNLKHPHNEEMIASKVYIFDLASKTLNELKCLLANGPTKQEISQKQGSFSQEMGRLLQLLSSLNPDEICSSDFDFLVGCVVFYSMYIADSSRSNIKLRLVKHCQNLLSQRKKLLDYFNDFQKRPSVENISVNVEQSCEAMKSELDHLSQTLASSIFYQILDCFTVNDPLKTLLKVALKNNKKGFCPQRLIASKNVEQLQAFQNHAEKLLKTSNFVMAQCSQKRNIEEILTSMDFLCRVRDEVVELMIDSNKESYDPKLFERAQCIYQRWIQATEGLMVSFDHTLTVHQFLDLSIKEIEENQDQCAKYLRSQNVEMFQHHAADLCDLAERVGQVINRHVDESKDPIFRNGLRVLVRQLERSVLETRDAIMASIKSSSCWRTEKSFLDKVKKLSESLYSVKDGVSGCNHPDLLSPLRKEAAPVSNKHIHIDLNDSGHAKEEDSQNVREPMNLLSYETYLSKPLPLITNPAGKSTVNTRQTRPLSDLQPLIGNLLAAEKKHNMKEIRVYTSSIIELSSMYLEQINEYTSLEDMMENNRFKQVESLILSLSQLTKEENPDPICMGRIIQTGVLLVHCIEDMKTHLVSLARYWFTFCQRLFCTSMTADINKKSQTLNQIMHRLKRIVQSMSEYIVTFNDDQNFSAMQESLVKIHVQFSKCQAAANNLLTRVLYHRMGPDTQKVEDICIQWSIAAQYLLKRVDDVISVNFFMPDSNDLAELKLPECKSLLFLCEASLWLQEASALLLRNCTRDKEGKIIGRLTQEVDALTESILKLRDQFTASLTTDIIITIDCVLLLKEITLKASLLMYHIEKFYNRKYVLLHRVVNFAMSFNSNDTSDIKKNFDENAKLLSDNVELIKDTLSKAMFLENKGDLAFMVDHLSFLTKDLIARTKVLIEKYSRRDIFMLKAMTMNYFAKVDQLISHLESDTEINVETVTFIKQCLQMEERMETSATIDSAALENVTPDKSIQSADTTATEETSGKESQNEFNDCSSEIDDGGIKFNLSNRVNQEHNIDERKITLDVSNEQKDEYMRSIRPFSSKQEAATQNKHKSYVQEPLSTLNVASQETTSAKVDDDISVGEVKKDQLEIGNPNINEQMDCKKTEKVKKQTLPHEESKGTTNINSKIRRTSTKRGGMLKQASNEDQRRRAESRGLLRKSAKSKGVDHKTKEEIIRGENNASPNQKTPIKWVETSMESSDLISRQETTKLSMYQKTELKCTSTTGEELPQKGPSECASVHININNTGSMQSNEPKEEIMRGENNASPNFKTPIKCVETSTESSDLISRQETTKVSLYQKTALKCTSTTGEELPQKRPSECASVHINITNTGSMQINEAKDISEEQNKPQNLASKKWEKSQERAYEEPYMMKTPSEYSSMQGKLTFDSWAQKIQSQEESTTQKSIKCRNTSEISWEQRGLDNHASYNDETLTNLSDGEDTLDQEPRILETPAQSVGLQRLFTTLDTINKITSLLLSEDSTGQTSMKCRESKEQQGATKEQDGAENQDIDNKITQREYIAELKKPTNQEQSNQSTSSLQQTKNNSKEHTKTGSVPQKINITTEVQHDNIVKSFKELSLSKPIASAKATHSQESIITPTSILKRRKSVAKHTKTRKQESISDEPQLDSKYIQKDRAGQISDRGNAQEAPITGLNCVSHISNFDPVDNGKTIAAQAKNSAVIMARHKESFTSLEDIRWQPHRMATCLLADEVETWEV